MKRDDALFIINNIYCSVVDKLLEKDFPVADTTEEGDSVLHLLAKSNHAEYSTSYDVIRLVNAGVDAAAVDEEGNTFLMSYLENASLIDEIDLEQLFQFLENKNFLFNHKNHHGKSIFDVILENKAGRYSFQNDRLLLALLKCHPASLLEKYSDGQLILGNLFKKADFFIYCQFGTLLELCKNQGNNDEFLKHIISECFEGFRQKLLPLENIIQITQALIQTNINIDVEYCLALTLVTLDRPSWDYPSEQIIENFQTLSPQLNRVIAHINTLTKEHSEERANALCYIGKFKLYLDDLSDDSFAVEEQRYFCEDKFTAIQKDTKMFGHLFSLSGLIPINGGLTKLTGSNYDTTAPFMVHLMNAYLAHYEKKGENPDHLNVIRHVRNMTVKAMRYYFMSQNPSAYYMPRSGTPEGFLLSMVEDSKNTGVEILTGWPGHGVNLIVKQDNFYRNNGGGCSTDFATEQYHIQNPSSITKELFHSLLFKSNSESNKTYIQQNLHGLLELSFSRGVVGKFQTVGNCSLQSMLIALKVKYRLFLTDENVADELFADTVKFFEQFYLEEYLSRYSNHPTLPHLLMRLIIQKLIPEDQLELAKKLLTTHFDSEANQEILSTELMLKRWQLKNKGNSTQQFDNQIQALGVVIDCPKNTRLQLLERFLNDQVTAEDLEELKSWPRDKQLFQGYHVLHFAVVNNNLALASSLIQMFPHAINQVDWNDEKPLCLVNSVEMVDLLIKGGACTDSRKNNALDCAIKKNKVDIVHALLHHGVKTSDYSSFYAATKNPKILQDIMECEPKAVAKITHGYQTGIHAAAALGHNENLHALIYYGNVHPNVEDVNGITPLQLALKNNRDDTAKRLLGYPGTLFKVPYRGDSLVGMTQDTEIQKMIEMKKQERSADLESFEAFKKSDPGIIKEDIDYLIVAIRMNNIPALRGCLLAYPKIKVVDTSHHYCTTPLTEAIQQLARRKQGEEEYKQVMEVVQMLLKTPGIDINARMATSEPILFWATCIDDVAVLELFLADPKLNPNQQDNAGYTALHDATERGHVNCVKRLLQDKRVDTTIITKHGKTAAELGSSNMGTMECVVNL